MQPRAQLHCLCDPFRATDFIVRGLRLKIFGHSLIIIPYSVKFSILKFEIIFYQLLSVSVS